MTMPWPNQEALSRLDAVLLEPAGRRFGVLGLGVVGCAMALHLARRGAKVIGADRRRDLGLDAARLQLAGVELRLGATSAATFADVDALAVSPGVHPQQPAVTAAIDAALPIFGELELAGPLPGGVAAITGTNGKSTTTSLLGALVAAGGQSVFVGGNLGDPIISWLDDGRTADYVVLELSSFQLETAYRFKTDVAVVLNLTPDHADRYPSMADYAAAKRHVVEALGSDGVAVLSYDDPEVRAMAAASAGSVWWVSTAPEELQGSGATLDGSRMVPFGDAAGLGEVELDNPRLLGRHNKQNAMAAILAAHALGITEAAASDRVTTASAWRRGYASFEGLEHRLEWVAELDGVLYINDSKATNDESAAVAVRAMDRPLILLLGGHDKGTGYARVAAEADAAQMVIAFGAAREAIVAAIEHPELIARPSMLEAVQAATDAAQPGDVILLSPACSSFDEFDNYMARGSAFKEFVDGIAERGSQ